GVGKTRLAAEFAVAVQDRGGCVLYGRADESLAFAYQPFVEALRGYLGALPPDDVRDHAARTDPRVNQLFGDITGWPSPGPSEPSSETDPATGRFRLFDAVAGLLGRIAHERPLLLVLDDIHWADRGSLLLLRHVTRSLSGQPVLIVLTAREGEPGRTDELLTLLAQLWTETPVARLSLGGLSETDVISLVRATADTGGDDVGREIHRLTDGNCFFARELARHVAAGPDPARLPESVVDVVRKRVAHLSETTGDVLRAAAVVGREFAVDVLAAVTDRSEDAVLDSLEEAAAARLAHEVPSAVDRFAFAHALVRDALGEELSASRRGRLHRRIGEAIESLRAADLGPSLADLARHFCAAPERSTMAKTVGYARAAAQRAQNQFAFEEAVSLLEGALAVLDRVGVAGEDHEVALRSDIELALGHAWYGAADPDTARHHYATALELARQSGNQEMLAEAALGVTADGVTAGEVDPAAVSVLREALDGLSDADASLRVRLLAQLTRELLFTGSPVDSAAVAAEGVRVARSSGDPNLLGAALGGLHQALLGPGDPHTRLAIADEIVTLAGSTRDPGLRRWGHAYRVIDRWQRRDIDGVIADIAAHERAAAAMRPPLFQWWAEALWAAHHLAGARFVEADDRIERARSLGRAAGDPNVDSTWRMQHWLLRWCQGRTPEVTFPPGPGSLLRVVVDVLTDHAAGRLERARSRLAGLDDRVGEVHR
ncbi:MAG: ATP-binding protein, partial [Acidimicrobiales bacterium]